MKLPTILFITLTVVVAVMGPSCQQYDRGRTTGLKQTVMPAGEVHEGWYFAAGDQVTIDGTINGDAYVAGAIVEVGGTINGDLIVAGGQVTISGTVSDDIRGAGGVVRVSGRTGKNVTVAGGSVVIAKEAEIGKNLLAAGGDIQVRGSVAEEAKLAAGTIGVTGSIKGNVSAATDELSTYPGASIGGNLSVMSGDSTHIHVALGTVHGKTEISGPEAHVRKHFLGMTPGGFWFKVLFTLSLFLTALVLAFLFPQQLTGVGTTILGRPGASALWGILIIILAPVVMLILLCTVIGVPLALFLLFIYLWYLYLSQLALGVVVGHRILGADGKHGWRLVGVVCLGILIVRILAFIPYIATLIVLGGMLFGVGALALITKDEFELHRTR